MGILATPLSSQVEPPDIGALSPLIVTPETRTPSHNAMQCQLSHLQTFVELCKLDDEQQICCDLAEAVYKLF
jgi:hypothetical protein